MKFSLNVSRRDFCGRAAAIGAGLWGAHVSAASPDVLPPSRSLPQELSAALAKDHPLIVMVSLAGCPYCHAARRSYLLPMWREGVPLVQVDMRSAATTVDFQGQRVTHDQLVQQWRISIAPTLLFFGPLTWFSQIDDALWLNCFRCIDIGWNRNFIWLPLSARLRCAFRQQRDACEFALGQRHPVVLVYCDFRMWFWREHFRKIGM